MPQITETAHLPSLSFTLPSGPATVILPDPDTNPDITINSIPAGSSWAPPPHWHETHTECFRIARGFALVTLGKDTMIVGPGDGIVEVKPFVIHSFGRADTPAGQQHQTKNPAVKRHMSEVDEDWMTRDVQVEEWTIPADGTKEAFFRNGLSFYVDEIQPLLMGGITLTNLPKLIAKGVHSMVFQSHGDNYLLLCGSLGINSDGKVNIAGRWLTYVVYGMSKAVNMVVGWKLWRKEYTPQRLFGVCSEHYGE